MVPDAYCACSNSKLISSPDPQLFDLAKDPGEKKNLAPQKPDLVAKAAALMKSAHAEDPNWPLTGLAERRKADRQGAAGKAASPARNPSGPPTPSKGSL